MHGFRRRVGAITVGTMFILTDACSRRGPSVSSVEQPVVEDLTKLPGTVFQVTYNDNTVVVEQATVQRVLRGVSRDHRSFLLDNSDESIKKLAPGKVVLLKGLALRKVVAMAPHGSSQVEVKTERAALMDAISDGTVKFAYPVKFGKMRGRGSRAALDAPRAMQFSDSASSWFLLRPSVVLADSQMQEVNLSGEFKGWSYTIKGTPSFNRLDVKANFKKQFQSATLEVDGDAYLSDFETLYDLESHDRGIFKYLDWKNVNLNGNLNVAWSAYYEGTGPMTEQQQLSFVFPYPLEASLELAGIPLSLNFGGAMLFKPGFTGKGELARGRFRVDYNGVEGLSLKGGNASPDGQVHGDDKIIEAPALSAIGPEGFINGFAFPRVELSFESDETVSKAAQSLPFWNSTLASATGTMVNGVLDAAESAAVQSATGQTGKFKGDLKTGADAYAEVVVVTSIVAGGMATSLGVPCEQVELLVTGKVGAHATFLGKSLLPDPVEVELFKHGSTQKRGCGAESSGSSLH
jgi:hypothetical protein